MSEVAPAAEQASAGTLLRRAREAAGLHVASLAVSLKVPVRKLEALEEDRYEDIGDAVFIRGLASSVCRTLKTDPQPVLDRLPRSSAPRLGHDSDGLNAPFRAPKDGPAPSWIDAVRQPVPLTVIALLVGAVVIALVPTRRPEEAPATVAAAAHAPAAVPASAAIVALAPQPAPAASEPAPSPVAVAALVAASAAAPVVAPASAASTSVSAAAAPAPAASGPASGVVVFRTKGESWVEVVDAKGAVPIRKLMAAGETAGASGALPLQVTIGKVDMTEVDVRGRKYDLRALSKDNVARFQIK